VDVQGVGAELFEAGTVSIPRVLVVRRDKKV
jgi:hypothetical protein